MKFVNVILLLLVLACNKGRDDCDFVEYGPNGKVVRQVWCDSSQNYISVYEAKGDSFYTNIDIYKDSNIKMVKSNLINKKLEYALFWDSKEVFSLVRTSGESMVEKITGSPIVVIREPHKEGGQYISELFFYWPTVVDSSLVSAFVYSENEVCLDTLTINYKIKNSRILLKSPIFETSGTLIKIENTLYTNNNTTYTFKKNVSVN